MSSSTEARAGICCANANCGIAEVDEVKMKEEECSCKLLRSCSDKCREKHRKDHQEERKKRVQEFHDDDDLFRQPDRSHLGECPLCFLPMPLDPQKSIFYSCCSKTICNGCCYVHQWCNGNDSCPFCREPTSYDDEENDKRIMERVKANDPAAMCFMGTKLYHEGDFGSAFEYWTKAAELGDTRAHYLLGCMYLRGEGVEKDEEKEVYHLEKAAIGGHPFARYNLGCYEDRNGNTERAVKHFIIAAKLGLEDSMKRLWKYYSAGAITKENLEATLRAHQAALDEMKSSERDEADNSWKLELLFPSTSHSG